tara:strand:- start:3126 stop:3761 length:636 start_codon:yes stop_codon:yes gene_type:complete
LSINKSNLDDVQFLLNNKFPKAKLLIVTKTRSIIDIKQLIRSGISFFGENRLQEAENKFSNIENRENLSLHLIGPLQTNKVKKALMLFDCIQTIDRKKLIDEIFKYKDNIGIRTKSFYIQVNIGAEEQKSGINKDNLQNLYNYCQIMKIQIEGLMCIPPNNVDPTPFFQKMVSLRDSIDQSLKLSMGMSNDYKIALDNGSNLIRVGSYIFK